MRRLYVSLAIRSLGLVVLCGLLYVALFPHTAAACGDWDFKCPVDVGIYSAVVSVSELLWKFNRMMLWAARWVEGLRVWLVTSVLGTALQATIAGVKFPFWIAAGVAWMVFVVSFMLQAIVQLNWVDLRRGLRNAAFAVIVFQFGSQAMAGMEQVRVSIGQGFSNIAETSTGRFQQGLGFYVNNKSNVLSDMLDDFRPLYASDPCHLGLQRNPPDQKFMSDYLAVFLYADAQDIHCPPGTGYADLPRRYAEVFKIGDISNESSSWVRDQLIASARYGLARQAQAVLPAIGAVLEQVMHLVFALALASLWFGLVISLIFSLFVPLEGMFKGQIDGMMQTLKKSWLASFWVGLVLALIDQAARSGNALVVNGISLGMFVLIFYQTRGALTVLRESIGVASTSLGQAPAAIGGMMRGFGRLAKDGAIIGAAAATGNGGELVEAGLQQMRRRLAFSTSGNLIAQAGERLLLNRAMGPVERWVQNEKDARAISGSEDEALWYEQRLKNPKLADDEKGRALRRTDEIDTEIEQRQVASTKRNIQQARGRRAWDEANKFQKEADEQEINRLERKIDEAQKSGDPKQMAAIPRLQERIDFLRSVPSAAVEAANGTVGVSAVNSQRSEPLAIGLQEVTITRASSGQLSVNAHAITSAQLSTDGHRVTLSAGNRAIDISRDDAAAANGLEVGKVLTVPASVRDPNGDTEVAPHAGGNAEVRAELELRIQEGQRQERALMSQRDTAFEEHRFADARKLGEQINALRAQIVTDRKALASLDRDRAGGAAVRVSAPPAPTTSAVSLSPSAADADDLAFVPPPGAEQFAAGTGLTPEERYQSGLRNWQSYVEQSSARLAALQQQQQLRDGGDAAAAQALDQQIAQAQTYMQQSQVQYNRIAAQPPAGVTPAPQIAVGMPGMVPQAPATAGPVMVQAPPSGGTAGAAATAAPAAPVAASQPVAAALSRQPVMVQAQPGAAQPASSGQPVMVQAQPGAVQPAAAPTPVGQPAPSPVAPAVQPVAPPQATSAQGVMVQAPVPAQAAAPIPAPAQPVMPQAPATPAVAVQAPPAAQRAPGAGTGAVPAVDPQPVTPAGPLHPSMVPPHARPAERPVPPAETPVSRLDPSMVPPGVGEPERTPSSAAGTSRTIKPRPWKNRERRRNGSRGGSGGTS